MTLQDVRFAIRVLLKNRALTAIIVLSMALAIGGAGSAFTWLKAVWLNSLPGAAHSSRLLTMNASIGEVGGGYSTSYRDFRYFRKNTKSFSGLAAYELTVVNVTSGEKPQILAVGVVSDNYFDVLGVRPASGRGFEPQDNLSPEMSPVAVISYKLWQQRFGADSRAIGSLVRINTKPFTVVGIAPKGFAGAYGGIAEDLWVPMMMSKTTGLSNDPESTGVQIIGRLKPGITPSQAQAEIHVLAQALRKIDPEQHRNWDEFLYSLQHAQQGIVSVLFPVMQILMGVAVLVLLIASANVANLLLARGSTRVREMGIRLAVGATRTRLLRQLLTESLLLAVLGGVLGVSLAGWAAGALRYFLPSLGGLSVALDLAVDWRVLLFCFLITLLTGVVFGFAPAVAASRFDVAEALRDGSRSVVGDRRSGFFRSALVVGQVAFSLIALVAATFFAESIRTSLNSKTGFDANNLLLTSYDTFLSGYSEQQGQHFYENLIRGLQSRPGVVSVSATSFVPMRMDGGGNAIRVSIPGYDPRPDESMNIVSDNIAPGYLKAMRIPLLAGREFTWQDHPGSLVVVVNEMMAKRYWKSAQNAIGHSIRIHDKSYVVAGVAADITYHRPTQTGEPSMYLCFLQEPANAMTLVVRTSGDPFSVLPLIEHSVRSLDPNMPVSRIETMRQSMRAGFADQELALSLLSFFGSIALVLTAIGAYGVLSYFVTLQKREIGVRLALGASTARVMHMVFGKGMRVALIGIALGLIMAIGVARGMAAMVYGIEEAEVGIFVVCSAFLLCIIALASYVPARRAMKVDPIDTLRYE